MNDKIQEYWENFCKEKHISKNVKYSSWSFGNTKQIADELAGLVDNETKTATTFAYELYETGEHVPQVGDYNVILNGSRQPICIIQTKVVYVMPYNLITPEHAWHEGEGDRSYEHWRKIHDDFFNDEYKKFGKVFYEQAPMLCEVFEKVY